MKILWILAATLASGAWAQQDDTKTVGGTAEATILATTGNSDTQSYGLASEVNYKPSEWFHKFKISYVSQFQTGAKTAEAFGLDLRSGRDLTERLDVFVGYNYQRNVFAGFGSRNTLEAGSSYQVLPSGEHSLRVSAALAFVNENLVAGPTNNFAAAKGGLLYKWKISETAELSNDFVFTANLKEASDWRLSDELALTAALNALFSLKTGFKLEHRNLPLADKVKTDSTTTVTLVAKF